MFSRTWLCAKSWLVGVAVLCTVAAAEAAISEREVSPFINAELEAHSALFDKKIYRIGDNVYSAVGWGLANTIMIEGDDGVIIVDTGEDINSARTIAEELRNISDKPVRAVIYTHFHPDHINGVKAYVSQEQANSGEIAVIAHSSLLGNVINQGGNIGPILGMRTGYTSGALLPPEQREGGNLGIGPNPNVGPATFIAPTVTYEDRRTMNIAGVELELRHVPSEAPDETAVYLPGQNILLSGEAIQGPTLPNIHTLRGTKFRDPVLWYKSIDVLRTYKAEHLVPSHGPPVSGVAEVERVLRVTRDGIQYIHDQTIRGMNNGLTPDELAQSVKLPAYLASQKPWLGEYYGTVKHSVRQIYQGYLGWFSGDPVDLDPTPRVASAQRYIALMGGRDVVLEEAGRAYSGEDYQWASELATLLIRVDHEDRDARLLKAAAFRQLGYASVNPNWRNWYLTSASELDGTLDIAAVQRRMAAGVSSPDLLKALPAASLVEGMSTRLRAELTADVHSTLAFNVVDEGERFSLEIRRGIAQFHSAPLAHMDAEVRLEKAVLQRLLAGKVTVSDGVKTGDIRLSGDAAAAGRFFDYFAPPGLINLTVR
ncbi:alkyl sulfatase dimerization domain-containing protein [Parahaliea mediterranea]|uniref:MBL fold metallo-hydrolase n=1 Tax=Parahaliea mediterranea TaxID=651086 RepID=A0A939IJQ7_9GAMM|nr:alkyl sulfatase dimerization domain-containing protein [Parahaliea mediterranea]MBN7796546.1 MBL fold metallo-hydrolase [Parahaliea mediterranea]